jgi:hypothetical protein
MYWVIEKVAYRGSRYSGKYSTLLTLVKIHKSLYRTSAKYFPMDGNLLEALPDSFLGLI